mmetsp:Transcript_94892/g.268067  ORF Transcript_94892/g.268067 Transcript_94892/m.268067 type:complete len:236 (+) Transcript_94892:311-1018(+)
MLDHGVGLVRTQVAEMVVRIPVRAFVGPNELEDVTELCILRQVVIHTGHPWGLEILEQRQFAGVDILEKLRVRVHGLLLKVAHEAVTVAGADQVGERVPRQEQGLAADDGCTEEWAGLPQRQGDQQVHALILSLCEQRVYPAIVPAHKPQRVQVPKHARDHAGHARDSLQEDDAPDPIALAHASSHVLHFVQAADVETPTQGPHCVVRRTVHPVARLPMRLLDLVQIIPRPSGLR